MESLSKERDLSPSPAPNRRALTYILIFFRGGTSSLLANAVAFLSALTRAGCLRCCVLLCFVTGLLPALEWNRKWSLAFPRGLRGHNQCNTVTALPSPNVLYASCVLNLKIQTQHELLQLYNLQV